MAVAATALRLFGGAASDCDDAWLCDSTLKLHSNALSTGHPLHLIYRVKFCMCTCCFFRCRRFHQLLAATWATASTSMSCTDDVDITSHSTRRALTWGWRGWRAWTSELCDPASPCYSEAFACLSWGLNFAFIASCDRTCVRAISHTQGAGSRYYRKPYGCGRNEASVVLPVGGHSCLEERGIGRPRFWLPSVRRLPLVGS